MRIKKIKDDMNQNLNNGGESNLVELLKNSQKKKKNFFQKLFPKKDKKFDDLAHQKQYFETPNVFNSKNDLEGDEEEKVLEINPKSSMSTNANFSLIQESSNTESNQSSGYKFKVFNIFGKKSKKDKPS